MRAKMVLFVVVILLGAGAFWGMQLGRAASPAEAAAGRDYRPLLQDPSQLGYEPTPAKFGGVYVTIRDSYLEPVTDDQLFAGMVAEVGILLGQAGIPAEGLKTLDRRRDALKQLAALYGDRIPQALLFYAATRGLVAGLGDPSSELMRPEEYRKYFGRTEPTAGIGVFMEIDQGQLTVFEPIEGAPAALAGVEAGDRILAIDGAKTLGLSLEAAQAALRGPAGSQVALVVAREDQANPLQLTITRDVVRYAPVTAKMLPDGIGYLRIRQFTGATADQVRLRLGELQAGGARALILDLRNNRGGYLDAAVQVAGQFVPDGRLAAFTVDRRNQRREYRTESRGTAPGVPLVLLVNRYSASGAEIAAAALREHGSATLVGEKTFGVGTVQQLFPFPDDSALKLTVARVYSPSGAAIGAGLTPERAIAMRPRLVGRAGQDLQLERAVEELAR